MYLLALFHARLCSGNKMAPWSPRQILPHRDCFCTNNKSFKDRVPGLASLCSGLPSRPEYKQPSHSVLTGWQRKQDWGQGLPKCWSFFFSPEEFSCLLIRQNWV